MTCGAVKPIDGADPLVCTRPRGHDGRHATLNAVGEAIAEWPTPWTADDERARQARQAWHKPHVRRESARGLAATTAATPR